MAFEWLNASLGDLADLLGVSTFMLNSMLAVVLLGTTCGMVGSTVVANRMAFFSDAMAHTAFAGISFALLQIIFITGSTTPRETDPYLWMVQPVMVLIGVLAGVLMVYVRERTGLTNDTVIGVFFAFAIGLGAVFLPALQSFINYNPEQFLFGSVILTRGEDLVFLGLLTLITGGVIAWRYNSLAIASFNPSLARSRGIATRANHYVFVILIALVVNMSINSVGVLLVNALLVVPAAAAANLSRNLRQVFWLSLVGTVAACVLGLQISNHVTIPLGRGRTMVLPPSGTIVLLCVAWFFVTMIVAGFRGRLSSSANEKSG